MQGDNRKGNNSIVLQVLSDLHGEWYDDLSHMSASDLHVEADATLIAGDTGHYSSTVDTLVKLFPGSRPVFAIPGNHEHYDTSPIYEMNDGISFMKRQAEDVSSLQHRKIEILEDNVSILDTDKGRARIIGSTLWTDFDIAGDRDGHMAKAVQYLVSDYGVTALTPDLTRKAHLRSKEFLADTLATPFDGASVVMTHHLPSVRSIDPIYNKQNSNAAFVSDLDDLIGMGATLWVHGHTHSSARYRDASGTLVVCNPLGRPHRNIAGVFENQSFNPHLTVSLSPDDTGKWVAR